MKARRAFKMEDVMRQILWTIFLKIFGPDTEDLAEMDLNEAPRLGRASDDDPLPV